MQQCTAELDTAVNNSRTANEQLQKLRGEASVLQLWQQNVQAERSAETEAVKAAKQVSLAPHACFCVCMSKAVCECVLHGACCTHWLMGPKQSGLQSR